MQKYVIIKLLEPKKEGVQFAASDWPLHVTLVPRFVINLEGTGLLEKMATLLRSHKPVEVVAETDELFGEFKNIKVTLLEKTPELTKLHSTIIDLLKSMGAIFDEPNFIEEGFRPHVTVQSKRRVQPGDLVKIDELSLIDMFPGGDINQRKVLKTIKFQSLLS